MKKIYLFMAVVFIGGIIIGYQVGGDTHSASNIDLNDHSEHDHNHQSSSHEPFDVSGQHSIPSVSLSVTRDSTSDWNAQITTENFVFKPDNVGKDHISSQGHAHIYVNGVKLGRVYGNWYHLGKLSSGTHQVEVRLSTNDHREIHNNGRPIVDVQTIRVE